MNEIEVALAVSARVWPDRLHRFLADHGGARVRAQVLAPEDAVAEIYEVLIIDDVSSFLTPRLVQELQRRQRLVLGVFDPADGQDGKERLRECGVDQVIESAASAEEFVVAVRALVALAPYQRVDESDEPEELTPGGRLIAVGAPRGGCGATEVAISIATRLSRSGPTVLIDVDEVAPSVAQRLNLRLLPNLRTAIDVIQHRRGDLSRSLQAIGDISVLCGFSGDRDWMEIRPIELHDVISELRGGFRFLVANVGPLLEGGAPGEGVRMGLSRSVIAAADDVVGVGLGHPVSVSRTIAWSVVATSLNTGASRSLLINRAPKSVYRRGEIRLEVARATGLAVEFLPSDERVEAASWLGRPVASGRFRRAVDRLVDRHPTW
jgi:MinD-like ATPase involved in chromosome partitioning or flagellar assembly